MRLSTALDALREQRIRPYALALYCTLSQRAEDGECAVHNHVFAKDLGGVDVRTVKRAKKELVEIGLIELHPAACRPTRVVLL